MTAITIITIVVIALLTLVIFGLTWLGYSSCIRAYRLEVDQGRHDAAIKSDYDKKLKSKKGGLLGLIGSYTVLVFLLGLFIAGLVSKINNSAFVIGNSTTLVIKTGSMSAYYNDELKTAYQLNNYKTYHFDVGDLCTFKTVAEEEDLVEGEIYGYKYQGKIITHRLIEVKDNLYTFRGDNNAVADPYKVQRVSVVYHYTGQKVPGIGAFVLFAQSYFGLWSVLGIIGVAISSEVVLHQIDKTNKARYMCLLGDNTNEN